MFLCQSDYKIINILSIVFFSCRVSPMSASEVHSSDAYVLFYELTPHQYQTQRL